MQNWKEPRRTRKTRYVALPIFRKGQRVFEPSTGLYGKVEIVITSKRYMVAFIGKSSRIVSSAELEAVRDVA